MSVIIREGDVGEIHHEATEFGKEDGCVTVATGTTATLTRQVTVDGDGTHQGDSTAESSASVQMQSRAGRFHSNGSQTSMSKARRKQRGRISRRSTSSVQIASSSSRIEAGSFSSMKSRTSDASSSRLELLECPSEEDSDSSEQLSSDLFSEDPNIMTNDTTRHSRYVIADGVDYHHIKSRNQMQERALAERRTALISGLDFLPFCEPDHTFPKFETLVRSESRCVQRPQMKRARAHYKRMAERFPTNYVALVNLACCHALLAAHAKAVPLLARAIEQSPEKAPAHVNLVLCLVELRDHKAALAAIDHTFSIPSSGKVAELSRSQKSLLLRCKAAIYFRSQGDDHRAMTYCCEAAVAAAVEDPIDAPHETRCGGLAIVNKEGDIVNEGNLRLELRNGIEDLKSMQDDGFQKPQQKPPWGRRHAFGCDKTKFDLAEQQGIGKWCHLRPDQVDELRKHLKQATFQEDRGKNAYETARMLTFFNRLEQQHAINILKLAELIEMKPDECVFKQGDVAEFMYVIAMGSVHIVVTDPTYGPYPVTVDTFYDGQSFGESAYAEDAGASIRRATVVAQEPCVLLRFRPADYRRVIGAAIPENRGESSEYAYGSSNTIGSTDEPSAELLLHRGDALETRMRKLQGVACFAQCGEKELTLLASYAQEISLRYGDIIVAVGKEPRGCFVIRDGFCKVFAPVDAGHRARDRRFCTTDDCSQASGGDSRSPSKTRFKEEDAHKLNVPCGSGAAAVRLWSSAAMRRTMQASALTLAHPPRVRTPIVKSWTRHKKVGRRPGTPRARTPWTESLRGGELSFVTGDKVAKEVDLGYLSPGQAFGLGAMFDFKQKATATVQVDSDVARVLVLTQRSLLYLPDTLVTTVMEKSNDMVDPVRPTDEDIRIARKQQLAWAAVKREMIGEEMTTIG